MAWAFLLVTATLGLTWANLAFGDMTQARCDLYPSGSDTAEKMVACTFAQRQGAVTLTLSDSVTYLLRPDAQHPGRFYDQHDRLVFRNGDLADQGLIFRFPDQSVYVYWNTAALQPHTQEDNCCAPFTTTQYDATTRLRCRAPGDSEFGYCSAGILRMAGSQASIVVQSKTGKQFTINFMSDYINATNRTLQAQLIEDTWIVTLDDGEIIHVPRAALDGG